jgi:peptidoglycan/LPS O-acetylase OafA/YrhL
LLYIIFFVCCRLLPVRAIVLIIISIIGFYVVQHYYSVMIGQGIGSFFLGGCVFLTYQTIIATRYANSITKYVVILMISAWAATLYEVDLTSLSLHSIPFLWHFNTYFQSITHKLDDILGYWPIIILFPLTILSLALIETRRGTLGKRVSFIGDISYSSYLLHFPLELLFSVVVTRFTISNSIYYAPWFMVLFFAVLITICLISFRYFEIPAQRFLRQTGKVININ